MRRFFCQGPESRKVRITPVTFPIRRDWRNQIAVLAGLRFPEGDWPGAGAPPLASGSALPEAGPTSMPIGGASILLIIIDWLE
jgi:hypothetical protein